MTIDDAIREHKVCAREQRKRSFEPYELYPNLCQKRAEEHEQYIEWLEELKFLRTTKETMYREIYGKGRADAEEEVENRFNRVLDDEKRISYQQGRIDMLKEIKEAMYTQCFERNNDEDMQKWDGGNWFRYKLFENVLEQIKESEK